MAVLSSKGIKDKIDNGGLKITPFDQSKLEPASYDSALGSVLAAGSGRVNLDEGQEYVLESNTWACVASKEVFEIPVGLCARYGIPSSMARRGLISFGGPQIDPGYRGKIFVSIYNPTLEPIALKVGEDFFTIIFETLDQKDKKIYSGSYQDQSDFPVGDVEMMMRMKTKNLSDVIDRVETLDTNVTSLGESMEKLNANVSNITQDVHDLKKVFSDWEPRLKILFRFIAIVFWAMGIAAGAIIANYTWHFFQQVIL